MSSIKCILTAISIRPLIIYRLNAISKTVGLQELNYLAKLILT